MVHYSYRRSALSVGVAMMGVGAIFVAFGIAIPIIAIMRGGNPDKFAGILFWTQTIIFLLCVGTALAFLVAALRRIKSGGYWSCVVDDQWMTWEHPASCSARDGPDRRLPVADIVAFAIDLDHRMVDPEHGFFIVTPTERLPLADNCFDQPDMLVRALLRVNPALKLKMTYRKQTFACNPRVPLEETVKAILK